MSDNKNQNRRKKSKSTKKKSSNAKVRKTRVTREYLDNEQEVLRLLERASVALNPNGDDKKEKPSSDNLSQSVEFFCKETDKGQLQTAITEIGIGSSEALTDEVVDDEGNSLESDDDDEENTLQDLGNSDTTMRASTTRTNLPIKDASSYIQLEFADAVNKLLQVRGRVQFEDNLLYVPKSELSSSIVNSLPVDQKLLPANTARLLNRYYEERAGDVTHVAEVAKTLSTEDCKKYTSDKKLYSTFCDHEFHGVFCEPTQGTVSIPTRKFIKLFFKELRFTEHAQLQPEHRIANMLTDYYIAYEERIRLKVCEKFQTALQTERKIVSDMLKREAVAVHTQDTETKQQRADLLAEHLQAVQKQRQRLYQAEAENKRLLQQILKTWVMLKTQRQEQGYQYTRVRLRIRMPDGENAAEVTSAARRAWTQRYETDLNESYREALETYYSAKRMWLQQRESNDAVELKRPKKPNLEKLAQVQRQKLVESIGQPDEPKIELVYDRLIDEKFFEVAPPAEIQHNKKERSYFLKVYFDGQPVGMTRNYRLETDLYLNINEAIGIFLERRLPKDINVALYEKLKLPMVPIKIANIIVPLPLGSDVTDFQTQHISFASHKQPLSGRLDLRFECDENIYPDDMIKVLFPPPKERTKIPKEILKGWQRQQLMEHQHSKNEMHSENESDDFKKTKSPINFATCTFEEDLLKFCSMDELANNKRFKILFSRYQKQDARTRDLRLVPALEHELAYDDLEEEDEAVIEAGTWINPIDLHKHEAKKYLKNFYDTIRNQCTRLSKVIDCSENLLLGDEPVTISSFFQALSNILSPRRPLYPARNNTTPSVQPQHNLGSATSISNKLTINFNVVRATGIPVRSSRPNWDNDNRQRNSGSSSMFMPQQSMMASSRISTVNTSDVFTQF